jgi:Domain of unknown function (DUF4190)
MSRFEPGFDDFDEPPPGFDESSDPESPRWPPPVSGRAIASLVFGVMFCVPLVPSLLAMLLGAAGLRETRRGARSGRRLAMTGLILGVVGVAGWLLVGSVTYLWLQIYVTEQQRAVVVAEGFLRDLSDNKVDDALARALPGTPREPLAAVAKVMQDWGRFDSLPAEHQLQLVKPRTWRWEFEGRAVFARADREVYIRLIQDGTTYRVERFLIGDRWAIGGGRWGDPK